MLSSNAMDIVYVPAMIMSLSSFSNTMNHKYVTKLVGNRPYIFNGVISPTRRKIGLDWQNIRYGND